MRVLLIDRTVVVQWVLAKDLDHQVADWEELLAGIAGVVSVSWGLNINVSTGHMKYMKMNDCTYPLALHEELASQANGTCSGEAWWNGGKAVIHELNLKKVLGHGANLDVIVVSLANAAKEGHWTRELHLPLELTEHEALSLEDLIGTVGIIDHVDNLWNSWRVDLLNLGSEQDGSGTDELKLAEGDNLAGEEAVDVVDAQIQSLWEHVESGMDLNEPIHEDTAHVGLDLGLESLHVVVLRNILELRNS